MNLQQQLYNIHTQKRKTHSCWGVVRGTIRSIYLKNLGEKKYELPSLSLQFIKIAKMTINFNH